MADTQFLSDEEYLALPPAARQAYRQRLQQAYEETGMGGNKPTTLADVGKGVARGAEAGAVDIATAPQTLLESGARLGSAFGNAVAPGNPVSKGLNTVSEGLHPYTASGAMDWLDYNLPDTKMEPESAGGKIAKHATQFGVDTVGAKGIRKGISPYPLDPTDVRRVPSLKTLAKYGNETTAGEFTGNPTAAWWSGGKPDRSQLVKDTALEIRLPQAGQKPTSIAFKNAEKKAKDYETAANYIYGNSPDPKSPGIPGLSAPIGYAAGVALTRAGVPMSAEAPIGLTLTVPQVAEALGSVARKPMASKLGQDYLKNQTWPKYLPPANSINPLDKIDPRMAATVLGLEAPAKAQQGLDWWLGPQENK